jgi:glycosyltransferase involved in cell wall biosynthesis
LGRLGVWYRRWRLAALHRNGAPIWGVGRWAIDGYRAEFGLIRPYFNVPYFSDLERFRPPTNVRSPQRTGCRFLFSGSFIERKGVDLLATAFARLAKQRAEVSLSFMGAGELESMLRQHLAACADRVSFLGFQHWNELPQRYWEADVLCVPSRYDGWGLVVPEGLAAGLPVIASDRVGAAVDLLQPGHNGWIFRAGDADQLYHTMERAAALLLEQRDTMARHAQQSVASHSLAAGAEIMERAALESLSYWRTDLRSVRPRHTAKLASTLQFTPQNASSTLGTKLSEHASPDNP